MKQPTLFDNVLQWAATIVTILGALFSSMNLFPWNVTAFAIGSAFWIWFAVNIRAPALFTVNIVILGIYTLGYLKTLI